MRAQNGRIVKDKSVWLDMSVFLNTSSPVQWLVFFFLRTENCQHGYGDGMRLYHDVLEDTFYSG